jgi:hypothetical protein
LTVQRIDVFVAEPHSSGGQADLAGQSFTGGQASQRDPSQDQAPPFAAAETEPNQPPPGPRSRGRALSRGLDITV